LSLASNHQPLTLETSSPAVVCNADDDKPVLKCTVLPSVVEQATLKPRSPLFVTQSVFPIAPHLAGLTDPKLLPGRDRQLQIVGQRADSGMAATTQKIGLTDKLSSLTSQMVLPIVVSQRVADQTTSGRQQLMSWPCQTFNGEKLSADTCVNQKLGAVDFSIEENAEEVSQPDDLSTEVRYKQTSVGDDLSSNSEQTTNVLERTITEVRSERTSGGADGLPTLRLVEPKDLFAEMRKHNATLVPDVDVAQKFTATPGECLSTTDKTVLATNTQTSDTVPGELKCCLCQCYNSTLKQLLPARMLRAGIVFVGICLSVCLSAQSLENY